MLLFMVLTVLYCNNTEKNNHEDLKLNYEYYANTYNSYLKNIRYKMIEPELQSNADRLSCPILNN